MPHNVTIRGFDDEVYLKLGDLSNQRNVSINSIVKNAVDVWLKQQSHKKIQKHHLIIYSDDESMSGLMKSIDRLAKEADLFRCFIGPPPNRTMTQLNKMKWYNGTVMPYYKPPKDKILQQTRDLDKKNAMDYCNKVMENISNNSNKQQICCMDFLIDDLTTSSSLKDALTLEKEYEDHKISGLMYCTYRTNTLFHAETNDIIELFENHDETFIVNQDKVYKLHITKENVHKLFLN